jgi:hypothetical protein
VSNDLRPADGDEPVAVETESDDEVVAVAADAAEAPGDDGPADGEPAAKAQITYELHEWAVESRVMLESLLAGQSLPHVWEGTDLQVPGVLESRVDGLIEQVEVTTEPNLDPAAPKVAYDLGEWDDQQQTELLDKLNAQGLPYDFDVDGSLIVLESDDAAVEAALDEIADDDDGDEEEEEDAGDAVATTGDEDEDDEDDVDVLDEGEDLDAQQVMSDLFVASDRLRRKASDHEGVLTLVGRAGDAERMRLPFGFNRHDWRLIVEQSTVLRDLIEDDESDDADIEARAKGLRDTLRPYV